MKLALIANWARAAGRVFDFYFRLGRKASRGRVFAVLGLVPVILAVVVRVAFAGRSDDIMSVFNDILMTFFLQFYIVILSLFFGTSITAEEVDGRTLPYIVTRPVPRSSIIAGKYMAYGLLESIMVVGGLAVSYLITNFDGIGTDGFFPLLGTSSAALVLGLAAYTAIFTLLGVVLKRSIIVGLMFGFGWENVIQYFPGSTQKFSVVHYLKSLLPYRPAAGGKLSFLLFRLEPTPPLQAVLTVILISAVFLAAACLAFAWKEYRFDE